MRKNCIDKIIFVIFLFAILSVQILVADIEDIEYPKLRQIKLPEVEQFELTNGMTVFLCEENDFPTIDIVGLVNTGSIYEPSDKVGLADLTSKLIRTGGTKNISGTELDEELDFLGASFSTSMHNERAYFRMSFLKEDLNRCLDILKDVLKNPLFEKEKIKTAKVEMKSIISRRNDELSTIVFREFQKLVYGNNSPYARTIEYETVDNITRQDIIDFHNKFYRPQHIILSVIGDFDTKEMKSKLEKVFFDWQMPDITFPQKPKVAIEYDKSINFVNKEEATQSWILIGHITEITKDNPDYFPMIILNSILGGPFNSRIYKRIRNRMGLSYAPMAYYLTLYDTPGLLYIMSQTKNEKVITAIEALIDEVRKMQTEQITDEELQFAKESFLNSFVFNFDTREKIVRRMMTYQYYDYPIDFIQKVKIGVEQVTKEDVKRVAKKYLHPDDFIILAVGNQEEYEKPLSSLGKVNEIDITIPNPEKEETKLSEEQKIKGKKIFSEMKKSIGNVDKIKNIKSKGKKTQQNRTLKFSSIIVFPDKVKQSITSPMGKIELVVNGNKGWIKSPRGKQDLPSSQIVGMIKDIQKNIIGLYKFRKEFSVAFLEEKEIEGKTYQTLLFKSDEQEFQLVIDKKTHLPYQMIYDKVGRTGTIDCFHNYGRI